MTDPVEPLDELVEHVAPDGSVIEVVARGRVRAETLRHRCTYVFVLRSDDRIVVHQRAPWKSIYPSFWDVCFGGICGVGEPWSVSAERELFEEAGIGGVELVDLGTVRYDADDGRIVGRVFVAETEAEVVPQDGEVVATAEVAVDDIQAWLAERSTCHDSVSAALPVFLDRIGAMRRNRASR